MVGQRKMKSSMVHRVIVTLLAAYALTGVLFAQSLTAISRVDTDNSSIVDMVFGDVAVDMELSQPIPFKLNAASNPNRIFIDFEGLQWSSEAANGINASTLIKNVDFGLIRPGWSRLVLELSKPLTVLTAEMAVDQSSGSATFKLRLAETDQSEFDAQIRPEENEFAQSHEAPIETKEGPLRIMIDPGHGGVDPGAVVGKDLEKQLMLSFAQELQDYLAITGLYEVYLTRDDDKFISLTGRIGRSRAEMADVFISLHADALIEGNATGITVYTLSDKASTEAAAQLAQEMDRTDLLLGHDLTYQDDEIAGILHDLAARDTNQRSEALADQMVKEIGDALFKSRMRPRLSAAFTVLKAPDTPSILIELGFITNPRDRANLKNPNWRAQVIEGIEAGLRKWEIEDAARAKLLRK